MFKRLLGLAMGVMGMDFGRRKIAEEASKIAEARTETGQNRTHNPAVKRVRDPNTAAIPRNPEP